jgi:hypothetical protein
MKHIVIVSFVTKEMEVGIMIVIHHHSVQKDMVMVKS